MADITSRYQGEVSDEGQQNWRGDQVSVPQGGQSIYKTSSVKLTEIGSRKVVGDRVFRYALASGACGAGDIAETQAASVINVTAGAILGTVGCKVFNWYSATAVSKDYWADGYLISQSGTAANQGFTYKIKSHSAIATTSTGTLNLYDPIAHTVDTADKYSIFQNPYANVVEATAAAAIPVGVAPIAVTSGDYFWLQTWGPTAIKHSAAAVAGNLMAPGATGEAYDYVVGTTAGNTKKPIGFTLQICTASERGFADITIAP